MLPVPFFAKKYPFAKKGTGSSEEVYNKGLRGSALFVVYKVTVYMSINLTLPF